MGPPPDFDSESSIPQYVAVGRIVKPHGLRGEVLVKVLSDNPHRFDPGSDLWAGADLGSVETVRVRSSQTHQTGLRIGFDGVEDPVAAEELRGRYLFVPISELGELAEGEYWEHELIGLNVQHVDGTVLGTLDAVIDRPGQDLWSVRTPKGEVLFPAAKDLVRQIDVSLGRVVIDPPEGLF